MLFRLHKNILFYLNYWSYASVAQYYILDGDTLLFSVVFVIGFLLVSQLVSPIGYTLGHPIASNRTHSNIAFEMPRALFLRQLIMPFLIVAFRCCCASQSFVSCVILMSLKRLAAFRMEVLSWSLGVISWWLRHQCNRKLAEINSFDGGFEINPSIGAAIISKWQV